MTMKDFQTKNISIFNLLALMLVSFACAGCVGDFLDEDESAAIVEIGNLDMMDNKIVTRATAGYHDFSAENDLPENPIMIGYTQLLPASADEVFSSTAKYGDSYNETRKTWWNSTISVKKYYDEETVMHNVFTLLMGKDVKDEITTSFDASGSNPAIIIQNIPAITTSNILASSGSALNGSTLAKGGYSAHLSKENHLMNFMMDNLMCGLTLNFNVGTKYDKLRHIVLKEITISSKTAKSQSYTTTVQFTTSGVAFSSVASGADADKLSYSLDKTTDDDLITGTGYTTIDDIEKGVFLSTEKVGLLSCFMVPELASSTTDLNNLELKVKYNIYNKKGRLTRKDQISTNSLGKALSRDGQSLVKANNMITLNITIEPTYLYQLSDEDLDNPGLTIENN